MKARVFCVSSPRIALGIDSRATGPDQTGETAPCGIEILRVLQPVGGVRRLAFHQIRGGRRRVLVVSTVGRQRAVGDAPLEHHAQRLALRAARRGQRVDGGVTEADVGEHVELARREEHHRRAVGQRELLQVRCARQAGRNQRFRCLPGGGSRRHLERRSRSCQSARDRRCREPARPRLSGTVNPPRATCTPPPSSTSSASPGPCSATTRRTSTRSRRAGSAAPLRAGAAGGHLHRAGHLLTGPTAARARHRRQRLVLPRPRAGDVLAAVEPARRRARRCGTRRGGAIRPFTCAKMFWWFNMYGAVDWSVTPRPIYPADGRKIPEIYSLASRTSAPASPPSSGRSPSSTSGARSPDIRRASGLPTASLKRRRVARADADARLPAAPRLRPPALRRRADRAARAHVRGDRRRGRPPDRSAARPRAARDRALGVRHRRRAAAGAPQSGPARRRLAGGARRARHRCLDPGASRAFAVADHQVAHVYVRDRRDVAAARSAAGRGARRRAGARRRRDPRSMRSITRAAASSWRSRRPTRGSRTTTGSTTPRAPDYARTVDIHRKPGYDPAELFLDPAALAAEAARGRHAGTQDARLPLPDERDSARRDARARLARTYPGCRGRRAGAHFVRARRRERRARADRGAQPDALASIR